MQKKSLLFAIFLFFTAAHLNAQDTEPFRNRASQYYLGAKDEILIKVNIWGYVQKPGQYLVPRHTDLISLISFAGGPRDGANLKKVRIIREGEVSKGGNGHNGHDGKAPILTVDVKNYLQTGRSSLIPPLMASDTVLIPQSFGSKLSQTVGITSVIGVLAAATTVVLIIERVNR